MHSSRMRTVRSSSHVYPSMHWVGLCVSQHPLGRGVSQHELGRGVSARGRAGVKTLPCRNYVADGKKQQMLRDNKKYSSRMRVWFRNLS